MKRYTVKEAAEYFKVGEATIRVWLKAGRFPHSKQNGKWLIPQCCINGHEEGSPGATSEQAESAELTTEKEKVAQVKEELAILNEKVVAKKLGFSTVEEYQAACADVREREERVSDREEQAPEKGGEEKDIKVEEEEREEFDDRVAGLDQWQEALEDLEGTIEGQQEAIDRQADNYSLISTESHKADEKVKAMVQVIFNIHRDITAKNKLDGWLDRKARQRLEESIMSSISVAFRLYSEGHGIATDKDGNII